MLTKELLATLHDKLSVVKRSFHPEDNILEHSFRVYKTVKELVDDEDMQISALCHDIIEDSDVELSDLVKLRVSDKSVKLILELTNDNTLIEEFGRSQYMVTKWESLSDEALLIKLADRLDNISTAFSLYDLPIYKNKKKEIDKFVSWYGCETQNLFYTIINDRVEQIKEEMEIREQQKEDISIQSGIIILYDKLLELILNGRY